MEQSWITVHVFQLTCLLTDVSYKKSEMSSARTQFIDKNVAYEVNPRMVVFSHESSIGDNQVIMVLGIQAHGDDNFHRFLLNYFLLHIFNLKFLRLWL